MKWNLSVFLFSYFFFVLLHQNCSFRRLLFPRRRKSPYHVLTSRVVKVSPSPCLSWHPLIQRPDLKGILSLMQHLRIAYLSLSCLYTNIRKTLRILLEKCRTLNKYERDGDYVKFLSSVSTRRWTQQYEKLGLSYTLRPASCISNHDLCLMQ
jgi:hypothetical protein